MSQEEFVVCILLAYSVVVTALFINKEWFSDGQE